VSQKTRDNLIVIGVLLAAVGVATAVVYVPQQRKLRALQAEISREKLKLAETAKQTAAVPQLIRQVDQMKKRYSNFGRRLPQQRELGGFLREISENLAQERLADQTIEPGSPTRAELFHTLPIVMRFHGSYLSLASFLQRLDEMERLTRVQRLVIRGSNTATAESTGKLNIEVLMNIYFTES
jgi:Tfp pilus assembly protein PilO